MLGFFLCCQLLHKGKKEECVSNLVCLIIAQPKILKSGLTKLEAL